ncbi:hypothetical protein BY996DRAFT_4575480 [Phakopsora pachyrhizi]|uniref:MPN domain-containing protein n=1 Tax=Phakopsora pachyrhizi TaxID=170000 RepID=A0AAV0B2H7_PHAPC|nr:hypothetical protein BY996DRAFT_4575480 [Phakopsora pachyrhizi]CAH7676852.1 hypothetical protein PPACK8108_LOCUS11955 [Phakopsora pachyrhizi]
MGSYVIEPLASLKALLHAAKYPHSSVIGLLVGKVNKDEQRTTILDAIPLVHHWVHLSPILEAGVSQADIYARSKGLKILGTYVAHSRVNDNSFDFISCGLNQSLKSESPIGLVIDNQNILSTDQSPFIPYTSENLSDWEQLDRSKFISNVPSNWNSIGTSDDLGDFDDHLEDIGIDWLVNPAVKLVL